MNTKNAAIINILSAHEPSRMETHAKKVLEDMREISVVCNAAGHRWALWTLLSNLTALAGDIERETDNGRRGK